MLEKNLIKELLKNALLSSETKKTSKEYRLFLRGVIYGLRLSLGLIAIEKHSEFIKQIKKEVCQ